MESFAAFSKAYRVGFKALNFDDPKNPNQQQAGKELYRHLVRKMGPPIAYGRHRITFANKSFVVKMPRNEFGIESNKREAKTFKQSTTNKHHLAPAKLVKHKSGLHMIVMPRLDHKKFDAEAKMKDIGYGVKMRTNVPKWAWKYDGAQVGYDRKGKLKAYDYGG